MHNNYKNLIVAATGTGKTVISAFDYKSLIKRPGEYPRLLFVAHREEILKQSIQVFRGILRDPNFGDLMVGGSEPAQVEYLFTSIQSLNSRNLPDITPADYYDMIIVDEFHHAAAPSYQRLLAHYNPKILLGLTATPERMDGLNILEYFNGKVTAEIRLPEAINRKLLAPFHYFGVTDVVDLDSVAWRRGAYDPTELSRVYTGNRERVDRIVRAVQEYTTDIRDIIGLGSVHPWSMRVYGRIVSGGRYSGCLPSCRKFTGRTFHHPEAVGRSGDPLHLRCRPLQRRR